jgi:hypothetical protein
VGGGLLNKGSLSLADLTLSDNTALYGGALANVVTATASLLRVGLRANHAFGGAGILNDRGSNLNLTDVMLEHNAADAQGGGLLNSRSTAILNGVTFSSNAAVYTGGAIENRDLAVLILNNSTLTGNTAASAGSAIWNILGSADLTFVTVSGNTSTVAGSGGLENYDDPGSELYLQNTLLVDNQPANCADKAPSAPSYTLSTDDTCVTTIANGNLPTTAQLLGPLANNGGPTLTQLPAPGSAAIDNGQCLVGFSFDQRGRPRLVGVGCDIGAVERQAGDFGWYAFLPAALR